MISTSFWGPDGKPISLQEFLDNMFGVMPEFFKSEKGLRKIWSNPKTRKAFLEKINELGYGKDELETIQKMIDAEQTDLFDVLAYISFLTQPITRTQRVKQSKNRIFKGLDAKQKEFPEFVLPKYEEKDQKNLMKISCPFCLI